MNKHSTMWSAPQRPRVPAESVTLPWLKGLMPVGPMISVLALRRVNSVFCRALKPLARACPGT